MKAIRSRSVFVLVVLGLTAAAVVGLDDAASALPVGLVTSRGALGETDYIDWGVLGDAGTTVSNPSTVSSHGNNSTTVSETSGSFARTDQSPPDLGQCCTWYGNFAPGDHLLWTGSGYGPVTIKFTTPVAGAGAQIQANLVAPFTATLDVYDPAGGLLGTFTLPGHNDTNHIGDNSAIFLGARDTTSADIGKIVYSTVSPSDTSYNNNFAINRLSLVSPVPEPTTLALLGSGLPVFVIAMRTRVRKRRSSP